MIELPSTAKVVRVIPKEAFYRNLKLKSGLQAKFVSDVEKFTVRYVLTPKSMKVDESEEITEIDVLTVQLKDKELDGKILEAIARQNPHKLLFEICAGNKARLALYYGKLYFTPWSSAESVNIAVSGNSMQSLWESFVAQIAIDGEDSSENIMPKTHGNIDEELVRNAKVAKLKKEIEKLDKKSRKETDRLIKYDNFKKYQKKCNELEQLLNGVEK